MFERFRGRRDRQTDADLDAEDQIDRAMLESVARMDAERNGQRSDDTIARAQRDASLQESLKPADLRRRKLAGGDR